MIRLSSGMADIAVPIHREGEPAFERGQPVEPEIGHDPGIAAAAVRDGAGGGALRDDLARAAGEPQNGAGEHLDRRVLAAAEIVGGGDAAPGLAAPDDLADIADIDEIAAGLRIAADRKRAGRG